MSDIEWWSTADLPADGGWHELTLDVSDVPSPGFDDPSRIVVIGLQLHSGSSAMQRTSGLVVFDLAHLAPGAVERATPEAAQPLCHGTNLGSKPGQPAA